MSFKAILKVDGKEYNVFKASYTISRAVDEIGRLTSSIVGGTITLEIDSSQDNMFFENICVSQVLKGGSIIFNKRHEDAIMRELKFEKAFISSFTESFDHSGHLGTMRMTVTLIAKVIKMGEGELGNDHFDFALNN